MIARPESHPWSDARRLVAVFALALAARLTLWMVSAAVAEWEPANLAFIADGHIYTILARTGGLYTGAKQVVPFLTVWQDWNFTNWFPLYPVAIRLVDVAIGDLRLSAILVSQLAGSLAVVAFYRLARDTVQRPLLATAVFAVFPASWLVASTLVFPESMMVLFAILAFHAFLRGRTPWAIVWLGLASVTQKHGIFLLPVIGLAICLQRRTLAWRELLPYGLALVPLLLLFAYHDYAFGDPFVSFRAARETWQFHFFGVPFMTLLSGTLRPDPIYLDHHGLRKLAMLASAGFYVGVAVLAVRQRRPEQLPLLLWLAVPVLFAYSLAGNPLAYHSAPRYCLLAAPPAVLLATELGLSRLLPGRRARLLLAALPLVFLAGVLAVQGDCRVGLRVWQQSYYDQLAPRLVRRGAVGP